MPTEAVYQLTRPTTVVVREGIHERLHTLDAGAVLISACSENAAGMIEATCEGNLVWVFERDLKERGERIERDEMKS